MNASRRARRFGRFLAAWLLLSFVAMAAPARPLPAAPTDTHCVVAHQHAHGDRASGPKVDPAHGGHSGGSLSHCPLCLHAAAPPPPGAAAHFGGDAPAIEAVAIQHAPVRVSSAAPPPGRGPPALS